MEGCTADFWLTVDDRRSLDKLGMTARGAGTGGCGGLGAATRGSGFGSTRAGGSLGFGGGAELGTYTAFPHSGQSIVIPAPALSITSFFPHLSQVNEMSIAEALYVGDSNPGRRDGARGDKDKCQESAPTGIGVRIQETE